MVRNAKALLKVYPRAILLVDGQNHDGHLKRQLYHQEKEILEAKNKSEIQDSSLTVIIM